MAVTKQQVEEVMERTESAYMRGLHYSEREWRRIAKFLLEQGYSVEQAEQVMRSKHMRWASDHSNGRAMTLDKFIAYWTPRVRNDIDDMFVRECGLPRRFATRTPLPEEQLRDAVLRAVEAKFEDGESREDLAEVVGGLPGLATASYQITKSRGEVLVRFGEVRVGREVFPGRVYRVNVSVQEVR